MSLEASKEKVKTKKVFPPSNTVLCKNKYFKNADKENYFIYKKNKNNNRVNVNLLF